MGCSFMSGRNGRRTLCNSDRWIDKDEDGHDGYWLVISAIMYVPRRRLPVSAPKNYPLAISYLSNGVESSRWRCASDRHDDVVALGVSLHFVQVEGQMVQNYGTKSRHERNNFHPANPASEIQKQNTNSLKLVGPDQIKSRRVEVIFDCSGRPGGAGAAAQRKRNRK